MGVSAIQLTGQPGGLSAFVERARHAKRVAMIVPPSRERIARGYYCTSVSKGRYYWPQIDHWVQGAYLQGLADVRMFDGVLMPAADLFAGVRRFAPDLAVISIGGFTAHADRAFAESLASRLALPWVATGEAVLFPRAYWNETPGLLGLLTNFAGESLARFLRDGQAGEGFLPLAAGIDARGQRPRFLAWGTPPDWSLKQYRFPMFGRPVASVLTTFGCPFTCDYCTDNRNVLGVRYRDENDLVAELATWAERGVSNLFFSDPNFGGALPRAKALLRRMIAERFQFKWVTFLRPELIDDELADLLHDAGCVQVQMGVESANQAVLNRVARNGDARRVDDAFRRLDRRGIRRGAHFVLGLPGETEADVHRTIAWARRLDVDLAAFNVGEVRAGTAYHDPREVGGRAAACGEPLGASISAGRMKALQRKAVRSVYLRPRFWLRLLQTLRRNPRLIPDVVTDGAAIVLQFAAGTRRYVRSWAPGPATEMAASPASGEAGPTL